MSVAGFHPIKPMSESSSKRGVNVIIHSTAKLDGDISIGDGTIIQGFCEILALKGPIVLGNNNILENFVRIVNESVSVYSGSCYQIISCILQPKLMAISTEMNCKRDSKF